MEVNSTQESVELDEYELELKNRLRELQNCQQQRGFRSCRQCSEFYTCETRKVYVDTVFTSMSKGETGGFEF